MSLKQEHVANCALDTFKCISSTMALRLLRLDSRRRPLPPLRRRLLRRLLLRLRLHRRLLHQDRPLLRRRPRVPPARVAVTAQ